jgi:hypothetical protein
MNNSWQRRLRTLLVGSGIVAADDGCLLLRKGPTSRAHYTNAQVDDYGGLPRGRFPWQPPLRLQARARFSAGAEALSGTAGFGFWNDPFVLSRQHGPALPRALWFFFASQESDMPLALDVPGHGWKAATIDAANWRFCALLPLALPAIPLMWARPLYRRLWPLAQRAMKVQEALVPAAMDDWHTYTLEWEASEVRFVVDGNLILSSSPAPAGPLGLVIWIDNQYMVATPQGKFRHGNLEAADAQWMEISEITIEV